LAILIDGHNLIGHLHTISLQDPDDEEKLARLLASYRARTGKAVTVVFDPGTLFSLSETRRYAGVQVVFAPQGSSADAVIARRVKKSRDPRHWLVVTSDHQLSTTVARLGARVQSAQAFAHELAPGQPDRDSADWRQVPPSPDEVDDWLNLFERQKEEDGLADTD
jgi:predicted RNA-binding protein with PIN domain